MVNNQRIMVNDGSLLSLARIGCSWRVTLAYWCFLKASKLIDTGRIILGGINQQQQGLSHCYRPLSPWPTLIQINYHSQPRSAFISHQWTMIKHQSVWHPPVMPHPTTSDPRSHGSCTCSATEKHCTCCMYSQPTLEGWIWGSRSSSLTSSPDLEWNGSGNQLRRVGQ